MIYYILKSDFDSTYHFQNWKNLNILESLSDEISNTVIMGADLLRPDVRHRLNLQLPTIYIHRGNLGNHLYKKRKWWRYSVNGFANTKLLPIPYPRWPLLNLPKHPWKVKKIKNVLIAPSKMTSRIWDPVNGFKWAEYMSTLFPEATVKIRYKGKSTPRSRWATLWSDLDWADLVVSQSSAITVEAFWYGKKVISLFPCPTWAAGCESKLDNWQDPREPPLRDAWHEHIAWSQFTNEEWASGKSLELIESYVGSISEYDPLHTYKF